MTETTPPEPPKTLSTERSIDTWRMEPGRSQEVFAIVDEALNVGVSILDEKLNYLYMNKNMMEELAFEPRELCVGDPLEKCHALMMEKGYLAEGQIENTGISADDQKARVSGIDPDLENVTVFSDGSVHRLVRKKLDNGYTVSMSQDITQMVKTETMLEEALDLGHAGYWVYDFKTKKFTLSKSLERMFTKEMRDHAEAVGIEGMVDAVDRPLVDQAISMLSQNDGKIEITARITHPQNGEMWLRTTGQAERGQDGRWETIQAFVKDITEERRKAKELEKAKDEAVAASVAKSEFLANMSHEIRTPMNGVLGMAELLAGTNVDQRQQEFIDIITRSSNALLTIINDILDFSKIEAGAFDLDSAPFDLQDALDDVAALISSAAREKELELIVRYPSTMPSHFLGDVGRLRQIVTNLIGNAVKFTQEGQVVVSVNVETSTPDQAQLTLTVADTGIGIEPEKLDTIFDKFTQADGSTTRIYGGTGLGLTISKHIAELMGGSLNVSSSYGEGSTFTLEIPLQINYDVVRRKLDASRLIGKRALIIDDIAVNRELLEQHLSMWGMISVSAKDGVEALTALKSAVSEQEPFDVILTDYLMPGINGQELATLISNIPELSGTPSIMLSSADQPVKSVELSKIGIQTYMLKPIRLASLHSALVDILSEREEILAVDPDEIPEPFPDADMAEPITPAAPEDVEVAELTVEAPAVPAAAASADTASSDEPKLEPQPELKPEPEPDSKLALSAPSNPEQPAPGYAPVTLEFESRPSESTQVQRRRRLADYKDLKISQTVMANSTPETPSSRPEKIDVLVAEDFQLNQDVVALMLQDTQYFPVFAANGKIALDMFKAEPDRFKAVLMDISMPVMDGYVSAELIHAFERANHRTPTPIIALTGHALKHDRDQCMASNLSDYLTKPVKQTDLLASLDRWCHEENKEELLISNSCCA